MNRIKIVQENGAYHLRTRDEEILLLKKTIAKDRYPIVVYSVSNFSVARKRNISLYTGNTDEIDRLLLFHSNYYIRGFDFLDIEIKNSDGTTNAANVLSSGQLNVLAIAIFIAKNISQNSTVIDFIGIDDPIQNMDDINQFSMIDVLSQLQKQLIFTTHDAKYVNLFLKKNELRLDDISVYYLDAENDNYENILN